MKVALVAAEQRMPRDAALLELFQEISADVRDGLAVLVPPGVSCFPVAMDRAPEANGGGAETRMRLEVATVFEPLDGDEFMGGQLFIQERFKVRDREGIAVEKDQNIVVASRGEADKIGQQIQFNGMGAYGLGAGVIELA